MDDALCRESLDVIGMQLLQTHTEAWISKSTDKHHRQSVPALSSEMCLCGRIAGQVGFDRDLGATRALQGDMAAEMLGATHSAMAGEKYLEKY